MLVDCDKNVKRMDMAVKASAGFKLVTFYWQKVLKTYQHEDRTKDQSAIKIERERKGKERERTEYGSLVHSESKVNSSLILTDILRILIISIKLLAGTEKSLIIRK